MRLTHGRTEVELHELRTGSGMPLLLLHALGESSASWDETAMASWPGSVFALDFAGHGASEWVPGNAYVPEHFVAEADLALQAMGPTSECAVVGAGIGAYVALLLAASRTEIVRIAMLLPGRGLEGGGAVPDRKNRKITTLQEWETEAARRAEAYLPETDPGVSECEADIRPDDYVNAFAEGARRLLLSDTVAKQDHVPSWWRYVTAAAAGVSSTEGPYMQSNLASALIALREASTEENAA